MSKFVELKNIAGERRFVNINNINEIIDIDQGYSCLVYLGENDCFKTIKTYDEVVAIIKQELRENDRQQAENEQLKRNLSQCENGYSQELHLARCKIEELKSLCTSEDKLIKELRAEIERLENAIIALMSYLDILGADKTDTSFINQATEFNKQIRADIKSEAIKEFAERLKERQRTFIGDEYAYEFIPSIEIDVLLAEMAGGENA